MVTVLDEVSGYDLWSATYDRTDNPLVALATHAFTAACLPLSGARFADLGCGTGRILERACAVGAASVVGIDGSPGMLRAAQARLAGWPRVELHLARLQGPWPAALAAVEPADLVCCMLVLEHVAELGGVLRQAARLVRPGGMLWLAELHSDLADAGTGAHFELDGIRYDLPSHPHSAAELAHSLGTAGFEVRHQEALAAAGMLHVHPKLRKHGTRRVLQVMQAVRWDGGLSA